MYEQKVKEWLSVELGQEVSVSIPPDMKLGDFSIPCFPFAKLLKKSPMDVAKDFKAKLSSTLPEFVEKIELAGPYLNVFLDKTVVAREVVAAIRSSKDRFGTSKIGKGKRVIIEFASPNTNKPLHLGHIRNICLGSSISKLYKSQGYEVIRANIVNDRGIHICKSMIAYILHGNGATPESTGRKADHFVGDYYIKFAQEEKNDPSLIKQAQELLQKWESADTTTRELWKRMRDWCEKGFSQTYDLLEVGFDTIEHESDIYQQGKSVVEEGIQKGVFVKDETGAVIAPLEDTTKLPNKVLIRSDGTSIYITQDMYLARKRHEELTFDELVYVVGSEQILHFKILFETLRLLGHDWVDTCHHFAYGMVYLPEGKMKSREGIVVDADDLILEMDDLAKMQIVERDDTLQEEELHERAHSVGLAALKFMMLKVDATKDIHFDPKQSIQFEGDTGPYLQYTHARAASILRIAASLGVLPATPKFENLSPVEEKLVIIMTRFGSTVTDAQQHRKPHIIIQYLLELAQAFNEFYHSKSVLKEADIDTKQSRLELVIATKQVLANGLRLLGIRPIEKM
jgi:arginyl-tRNA synthetase